MSERARIIAGGGLKQCRILLRWKAWGALGVAVAMAVLSVSARDSAWFYAWIAAATCGPISFVLFRREKPRPFDFTLPWGHEDPGKLYAASREAQGAPAGKKDGAE